MGLVAAWVQRFPACILTPPKPPPLLFSTYPSRSSAPVHHFMVSRFDGESRFQAGGVKSRSAPAVSDGICSLPVAQFRVCSERLAQRFFAMPPLEHVWKLCRNGRHCVSSVWGFLGRLSRVPTRRVSPLRCVFSGHDRGLQFAGANWSRPPRTKEKTKRRCKGPSDMSMPMPTNVARRAGAKIKNQREPTSCVRLIWRCFFGPQMEGWIARKPCLTPAHPSSRELNIYTK